MTNDDRIEAIVRSTMMDSALFWKNEYELMTRHKDMWKQVADMFATAEESYERIMAFEAWEELTSRTIPKDIENK